MVSLINFLVQLKVLHKVLGIFFLSKLYFAVWMTQNVD